jgi:hypothetical protein
MFFVHAWGLLTCQAHVSAALLLLDLVCSSRILVMKVDCAKTSLIRIFIEAKRKYGVARLIQIDGSVVVQAK